MKKKYINPTTEFYQLEIENVCNDTSIISVNEVENNYPEDEDTDFAAGAYRSNLWQ